MTNAILNTAVLKTIPFFAALPPDQLARLFPAIQNRHYPRNAYMMRAQERPDGLYVLMAGRAKVLVQDGEGREVILSTLDAGQFFGEMSLIDGRPRSATVQALEPCTVLYVPKCAFSEFMQSDRAALLVLETVVNRLREADKKIEGLALTDVYTRVSRVLVETSREVNGSWMVGPGSEQIAKTVGASREMVSRVLKDLREKGVIGRLKRKIILLDRDAVARRARMH